MRLPERIAWGMSWHRQLFLPTSRPQWAKLHYLCPSRDRQGIKKLSRLPLLNNVNHTQTEVLIFIFAFLLENFETRQAYDLTERGCWLILFCQNTDTYSSPWAPQVSSRASHTPEMKALEQEEVWTSLAEKNPGVCAPCVCVCVCVAFGTAWI